MNIFRTRGFSTVSLAGFRGTMVIMSKKPITFALRWSVLVLIGTIVGFAFGMFLVSFIDDRKFAEAMFLLLFIVGLFVGLGQWFAIRSKLHNSWWWIPATAIGYSVGCFGFFVLVSWSEKYLAGFAYQHEDAQIIATLMLTGMLTGALQCLALGKKLKTLLQWALVSCLSHATVGFLTLYSPFDGNDTIQTIVSISLVIICVLMFSFLTGIVAGIVLVDSETQAS